jgi:hypothetical protein
MERPPAPESKIPIGFELIFIQKYKSYSYGVAFIKIIYLFEIKSPAPLLHLP